MIVLGIDAAWTTKNASGVALASCGKGPWEIIKVSGSYRHFLGEKFAKSHEFPAPKRLVAEACRISGEEPTVIAVDIPLSRKDIDGRRTSDDAISKEYGARWCGTHTPSKGRPGAISNEIRDGMFAIGYELQTNEFVGKGLVEVYPHPALLALTGAVFRMPYKFSKIRNYWPDEESGSRKQKLFSEWQKIIEALERHFSNIRSYLEMPDANAKNAELKDFEDMLDAVVCAWIGAQVFYGHAKPFGDSCSSIWVPVIKR